MEVLASALTSCASRSQLKSVVVGGSVDGLDLPEVLPVRVLLGMGDEADSSGGRDATSIDLRFRCLDTAGVLVGRLVRCNTSLHTLDMRCSEISGQAAEVLAACVIDRENIRSFGGLDLGALRGDASPGRLDGNDDTVLDFSRMMLGPAEAHVLTHVLRSSCLPMTLTLHELRLQSNQLDDASIAAIIGALSRSRFHKELTANAWERHL